MENNKNNKSKTPYGYFYKEKSGKDIKNIKDFFQKTDFKKYGKYSFKGFKWAFYLFLIITTLWGCVQGFIIKQSNLLGHGFEIYKNKESVNPNMYLGVQSTMAKITPEARALEINMSTPAGAWTIIDKSGTASDNENPSPTTYNPMHRITEERLKDLEEEEKKELYNSLNWKQLETTSMWDWLPNWLPNNYNDINKIKPVSDLFKPSLLFSSVEYGEYKYKDSNEEDHTLTKGIKEINNLDYISKMHISLKWYKSHENKYISQWNSSFGFNADEIEKANNIDSFTSGAIKPWSKDQIDSEINDAYYGGQIAIGSNDGLLYSSTNDLSNTRAIKWDSKLNKEDLDTLGEDKKNATKSKLDEYFPERASGTKVKYIDTPEIYYNILPEQAGLHLQPSEDDMSYMMDMRNKDKNWNNSHSNEERVVNAGWTIMDFKNNYSLGLENMKEQYIPSFYSNNSTPTVDVNGQISEGKITEKLYTTNRDDWNEYNTDNISNDLLPHVDWGNINSHKTWKEENKNEPESKSPYYNKYGYNLKYAGLSPVASNGGVVNDTNFKNSIDSRNDLVTTSTNQYINSSCNPSIPVEGDWDASLVQVKEDYNKIVNQTTGFDANQKNRVIVTNWGEAWTHGPFYGMFVYPLSWFATQLETVMPVSAMGGWSVFIGIMIIVFLLRGLSTLATFKNYLQQQKMQDLQLKVAKINAKYERYKDNPQMKQRKQMETMKLYQKEGVNPLGSLSSVFLTMPMFLAMWRIISSLPIYKGASIGPVDFTITPISGIFNGLTGAATFIYLLLLISTVLMQFISFKLPTWLSNKRKGVTHIDEKTKKAQKKQQKIGNWMIIFFLIMSITIPSLLALYWMLSGLFTMTTTWLQHLYLVKKAEASKEGREFYGPIDRVKLIFKKIFKKENKEKVESYKLYEQKWTTY